MISRLPHGFYEDQLRAYFAQFGEVVRLRVSRNKKVRASRCRSLSPRCPAHLTLDRKVETLCLPRIRRVLGRTDRRRDDGQLLAHGTCTQMQGDTQGRGPPRAVDGRKSKMESGPPRAYSPGAAQQGRFGPISTHIPLMASFGTPSPERRRASRRQKNG